MNAFNKGLVKARSLYQGAELIKMKTKIQKHFKEDNCIVGNDRNCSPNQEGEITTLPLIFTTKIREETAALKM